MRKKLREAAAQARERVGEQGLALSAGKHVQTSTEGRATHNSSADAATGAVVQSSIMLHGFLQQKLAQALVFFFVDSIPHSV